MHYDTYTSQYQITPLFILLIYLYFMYQLQLLTSFQHKCTCQPPSSINQEDLIDGLLKHNTKLTKYLSKYTSKQYQQPQEPTQPIPQPPSKPSNQSIVEEKGLNFGIPDENKRTNKQQPQSEPQPQKIQTVQQQQQTSPIPIKKTYKKPQPKTPFGQHYKELNESSRYLSDTGFRKYFGRQCFENYGRNNTTGVADGIVYGNYMKTHNINPHSGYNMPIDGQTFNNALTHAQSNKYKPYEGVEKREQHEGKPIYKENYQIDKIREEAIKNEKDKLKYSRMKLVSKQKESISCSPIKQVQQVKNIPQQQIKQNRETQIRQNREPQIRQNREIQKQTKQIQTNKIQLSPISQQQQLIKQPKTQLKQRELRTHQPIKQIKSSLIEYKPPLVYLQEQECVCTCSRHMAQCVRCRKLLKQKIVERGFESVGLVNRVLENRCRR